jgi:Mrp family chromosome partitioning ATPase
LAGTVPLEDALVDFRKDAAGVGQLTVLPVGRPPSNPSALITSDEMKRAIRELESKADLVIIDTPAALAVSDPLALMRGVSGVLLVARMNRSGRQRVRRLQRIITAARGTLLGVVATGVTAGDRYEGYAYGYYAKAAANGTNGRDALRRTKPGSESDVTPQKPE